MHEDKYQILILFAIPAQQELASTSVRWVLRIVMVEFGPVVQLVSTSACHAEGHGFEPRPGRKKGSVKTRISFVFTLPFHFA